MGMSWRDCSGILEKYNSSGRSSGAKTRLLSAYDNRDWKVTRKGDEPEVIRNACLSIFGTIQGGVLETLFSDQDLESGLIPRFMFIRSEQDGPRLWSDESIDGESQKLINNLTSYLLDLEVDLLGKPMEVRLTKGALEEYKFWFNRLSSAQFQDIEGQVFASQTTKLQEQCLRLCLILHGMWSISEEEDMPEEIPLETMRRAIELSNWFGENQRQVWQVMGLHDRARETDSWERKVAEAILLISVRIENEFMSTGDIADIYNEGKEKHFRLRNESIGKLCVKLGFSDKRGTGGVRGYRVTEEDVRRLESLVKRPVTTVTTDESVDITESELVTV